MAPFFIQSLHRLKTHHWTILSLFGLAVFFILLHWNSFAMPFERDEGEYAYSAWILREGGLPYRDAFMQKPPMIIYTYALAQMIDSDALWLPRLLAVLFLAGTTVLVGFIARKEFGRGAGMAAMWLVAPMLAFPFFSPFAANTEVFMLLPLVGALAIYANKKAQAGVWNWFWAGTLSTVALLYKPIALFIVLFLFSVWVAETWKVTSSGKVLLKNVGAALLGVLVTLAATLGYFIFRDGGRSFWETAVMYNWFYTQREELGIAALLFHVKLLAAKWWPLFLLLAWFFAKRPRRWWFYSGLLFTAFGGAYRSWIGHYYLLVIPFLALISSVAITSFINYLKKEKIFPYSEGVLNSIVLAVVIVIMLIPAQRQFFLSPRELSIWVYGTGNPFVESELAAEKLAEITNDYDKVFIAGSEPQILYYSERKSASRFVITYPLIIDTPAQAEYQREARTELEKDPPRAVVYSRRPESGLWNQEGAKEFMQYLDNMLAEEYSLSGGYVRGEEESGTWKSELSESDISASSLLLYNRKD